MLKIFTSSASYYRSGDTTKLTSSWNTWVSKIKAKKIFVGLPASTAAASSGYIPPNILKSKVLPVVKRSWKYGGIMLWNRYSDAQNNYSGQVRSVV